MTSPEPAVQPWAARVLHKLCQARQRLLCAPGNGLSGAEPLAAGGGCLQPEMSV